MQATNIDFDSKRFCLYNLDNNGGGSPMPIGEDGNIISVEAAKQGDGRLMTHLAAQWLTADRPDLGIAYFTGETFIPVNEPKAKMNSSTGAFEVDSSPPSLETIDALSLQKKDIPPRADLIQGIYPEKSLLLVVGPPKFGKSAICLDAAICIATGQDFLGRKVKQGQVLYLDLESTERRSKSRIDMILNGKDAPPDLFIATGCELLGQGLKEQLADFKANHPGLVLVIIDMLSNVRPPSSSKVNIYDRDRADLGQLETIVNDLGISIMTVHHTRKMKDEADVFNQISGSTGLLGTTDLVYLIDKKKRQDVDATLYITGRDIPQTELAVSFDASKMTWVYRGTADEYLREKDRAEYEDNAIVKTIRKLLASGDEWTGTVDELRQSSVYFKTNIGEDNRSIGKELRKLAGPLLDNDGIEVITRKGVKRTLEIIRNPDELPFDNN